MTEIEKLQVAINVVAEQRNAALNDVVNLRVELALAREELAALKAKPEESAKLMPINRKES